MSGNPEYPFSSSDDHLTNPLSSAEMLELRKLLVSTEVRNGRPIDAAGADQPARHYSTSILAQMVLDARRVRTRIFGTNLFSDPAYDILLELFIRSGDVGVSMAKACAAADAPESTALRYVRLLIEHHYLERADHPHDKRIVNVKITDLGIERMDCWLMRFAVAMED